MDTRAKFSILDCFGGIESVNAHFINEHFSKHIHEGYAVGIITEGSQKFYNLGENHISEKGSLVIINADTVHTGGPACNSGWSYRAIYPTPELINDVLSDLPNYKECTPFVTSPVIDNSELINHLITIFSYADLNTPRLVLESLIYTFFLKLVIIYGHKYVPNDAREARSNIERVRSYLSESFAQNVSLDELTKIGNINKFTLIKQFKDRWGLSPHQYQIQLRIQQAKRLLKLGYLPSDVAVTCGFYDQSHFSSQFKKVFGATPTEYRIHINHLIK